ncbi:hypothetical protein BGX33_010575 [Mortierella sp. NVP41]|nr:hypothetical protein BGX33_010575 [Mortierella sp. NVP41]
MALFLGRLTPDTRSRDLEDLFGKYGRVTRLDIKRGAISGYGFVEYEDPRDADEAVRKLDGTVVNGRPIVVEFAKNNGHRAGDNECFKVRHWARDCRSGGRGDRERRRSRSPRRRSRSRSRSPRRDYDRDRGYERRDYDRRDRSPRRDYRDDRRDDFRGDDRREERRDDRREDRGRDERERDEPHRSGEDRDREEHRREEDRAHSRSRSRSPRQD